MSDWPARLRALEERVSALEAKDASWQGDAARLADAVERARVEGDAKEDRSERAALFGECAPVPRAVATGEAPFDCPVCGARMLRDALGIPRCQWRHDDKPTPPPERTCVTCGHFGLLVGAKTAGATCDRGQYRTNIGVPVTWKHVGSTHDFRRTVARGATCAEYERAEDSK